ncbi:MAG: type IV secretion system protein VirB3 [Caulobacter sp.]
MAQASARDTLFLACTRPAMFLGVPMEAMGVTLIIAATAFIGGRSPLYLLVAPAVHLVLRAVCRTDHNALRLMRLWIETRGRSRNADRWGGSAFSPLILRKVRHA